jgi:AmmeMemoRadiSam system protein A
VGVVPIMREQRDLGIALLGLARCAIGEAFGTVAFVAAGNSALGAQGATFVTLRRARELRGCIGTVDAWRSLGEDVRANAVAAAFHDPRFPPLARDEFDDTSIEVSLLGAHEPVPARNEAQALARLRPGVDGLLLQCGRKRATFLPQVWEQLPQPGDFLHALKRKAGLAGDFWSDEVRLTRYGVEKFVEDELS